MKRSRSSERSPPRNLFPRGAEMKKKRRLCAWELQDETDDDEDMRGHMLVVSVASFCLVILAFLRSLCPVCSLLCRTALLTKSGPDPAKRGQTRTSEEIIIFAVLLKSGSIHASKHFFFLLFLRSCFLLFCLFYLSLSLFVPK